MSKRVLIIHCSDSPRPEHGVDVIRQWHTDPIPHGRGWQDIGYHYVIERSGELKEGRPLHLKGAHTFGHNEEIGLCLCGLSGDFMDRQVKNLIGFVVDNRNIISQVKQHSDYDENKPHCAGLSPSFIKYLNSLL